jgi:hypothetical protein
LPTYEYPEAFLREFRRLSPEQRERFLAAVAKFVDALREQPARLPPGLRVKAVQGSPGVWELTFAPDGRATFTYGAERKAGEPHVVWRRIGNHSIFANP